MLIDHQPPIPARTPSSHTKNRGNDAVFVSPSMDLRTAHLDWHDKCIEKDYKAVRI